MRRREAATERDRFWLAHEAKLASSEATAKAYAAEHSLSLHAFYQARKRLRGLGLLAAGAPRRSPKRAQRSSGSPKALRKSVTSLFEEAERGKS